MGAGGHGGTGAGGHLAQKPFFVVRKTPRNVIFYRYFHQIIFTIPGFELDTCHGSPFVQFNEASFDMKIIKRLLGEEKVTKNDKERQKMRQEQEEERDIYIYIHGDVCSVLGKRYNIESRARAPASSPRRLS